LYKLEEEIQNDVIVGALAISLQRLELYTNNIAMNVKFLISRSEHAPIEYLLSHAQ
jgi:hypothetical protein